MASVEPPRREFIPSLHQTDPPKPETGVLHPHFLIATKRRFRLAILSSFLLCVVAAPVPRIHAQTTLPFEISNPKNKKWEATEAVRIYSWACNLLARTIRPEKPPQLHPSFRLVLGAENDEFVHQNAVFEIRLKSWNPEKFSQGVVLVAMSGVVQTDELNRVAHQSVSLANSTLDIRQPQPR
jgi:hypothetical protein